MSHHLQYYSNNSNTSSLNNKIPQEEAKNTNSHFSASFYKHLIEDLKDESLAWRVSYELGGQRIYIPKNPNKSAVFKDFGEVFCNWLSKNYSGEQIIFPLGPAGELNKRSMQAINLAKRGFSTNEIAKLVGYSYRNVQYKKAKAKNYNQLNLFEQDNQINQ